MENKHIPIETEIGVLRGRDAIMLHDIELNDETHELLLSGDVSGYSIETGEKGYFVYDLIFKGVVFYEETPIDEFGYKTGNSCFDEVLPSREDGIRKFIVRTYDDVVEINARSFSFTLGSFEKSNPPV
jgi:hypothetical protein